MKRLLPLAMLSTLQKFVAFALFLSAGVVLGMAFEAWRCAR